MSDAELMRLAEEVAGRAYCPYSKFRVGAAVLSRAGGVYVGCNVENASYGLTICAERGAVMTGRAAEGEGFRIERVVLSLPDLVGEKLEAEGWPCGSCRQVLSEFADPEVGVLSGGGGGGPVFEKTMGELLPHCFRF
ncbi:MAG: cytidine deaminase [Verrucomicrobiota bacterium]